MLHAQALRNVRAARRRCAACLAAGFLLLTGVSMSHADQPPTGPRPHDLTLVPGIGGNYQITMLLDFPATGHVPTVLNENPTGNGTLYLVGVIRYGIGYATLGYSGSLSISPGPYVQFLTYTVPIPGQPSLSGGPALFAVPGLSGQVSPATPLIPQYTLGNWHMDVTGRTIGSAGCNLVDMVMMLEQQGFLLLPDGRTPLNPESFDKFLHDHHLYDGDHNFNPVTAIAAVTNGAAFWYPDSSMNANNPAWLMLLINAGYPVQVVVPYTGLPKTTDNPNGTGKHYVVVTGYNTDSSGNVTFYINNSGWTSLNTLTNPVSTLVHPGITLLPWMSTGHIVKLR